MKKIGLCISGGGTKGLAAIALVEELLKSDITFSHISGTSVGAIIGGYLALNGEVSTLGDHLLGMSSREWFKLLDPSVRSVRALIKGKNFHALYKQFYGDSTFANLKSNLIIPVTDLQAGKVRYLTSGKLIDAISATSAYPGVFPPYMIKGKPYCDGGVFDNLPYEILLKKGVDKIIAINLLPNDEKNKDDYSSMASVVTRSFDLMMGNALKRDVPSDKRVYVFTPRFTGRVSSTFGVNNLDKKYRIGTHEYKTNRAEFEKWMKL